MSNLIRHQRENRVVGGMQTVRKLLKTYRKNRLLSLAAMARLLEEHGIRRSRAQIYNYETGCQTIPREVLMAYVAALDLDIEQSKELYEAAGLIVLVSV